MHHTNWTGSHYEAGLRYGALLRERRAGPPADAAEDGERAAFAAACLPLYEAHFPEALAELRGVADGLGTPFEKIAAFLLPMYSFPFENRCSCFAFVQDGRTVFGRNSDFAVPIEAFCDSAFYNLDGARAFVGNTTAWTEIEDGVNESGLAAGLTFVCPVKVRPGLNAGMLVRYLLEKCAGVGEALAALRRLPIASAQTITLADRGGELAVAECCCDRVAVRRPRPGERFVFAVNHFTEPEMRPYRADLPDGVHSHQRLATLERAFRGTRDYGGDFAADLLAGRKGFLCQYDRGRGLDTLWSTWCELATGGLFRAEGNPARVPFEKDARLEIARGCVTMEKTV